MDKVTIDGWVAREKDDTLYIFTHKPIKREFHWLNNPSGDCMEINSNNLQQVKWEDEEPTQVTLTIQI